MLKTLLIKNFALIDELEVSFDKGLNILTGETGSGKSIIIGAIDIALGARASKDVIKSGKDKAYIEICLDAGNVLTAKALKSLEIDHVEGEDLIISREITSSSAKSRINGILVNQTQMQEVRKTLLDIHTQHENYNFINPALHIELLDSYGQGEYGELLREYRECYNTFVTTQKQLDVAQKSAGENAQKVDFLTFQIDEIKAANITNINEYEELTEERNVLINAEELKALTFSGYSALYGEEQSITDVLGRIEKELIRAAEYDPKLSELANTVASSVISLKEAAKELRNYSESLEINPQRLEEVETRINLLDKLKRKYGPTLSDILNNLEKFEAELSSVNFSEEKLAQLEAEAKENREKSDKLALELSAARKTLAEKLSSLIQDELVKLEMPKTRFSIDIQTGQELGPDGYDRVEFLISTNTGEPLKPLAKIASGGEISRVMLAIKGIFARTDMVNTVIFDEIDTGISGKASQAVAEAFAELAKTHQIICITHQPIIAAMADNHILIQKAHDEQATRIIVETLDSQGRLKAIASLASGLHDDVDALNFAGKLLSQADARKKEACF
ncbi:MAG: DNA repair protein RecN [Candidatus Gastranaerophilales bacterium]|nr:DNA repair protein RecN [Candidatus Gastranaerophilales bacterium]